MVPRRSHDGDGLLVVIVYAQVCVKSRSNLVQGMTEQTHRSSGTPFGTTVPSDSSGRWGNLCIAE